MIKFIVGAMPEAKWRAYVTGAESVDLDAFSAIVAARLGIDKASVRAVLSVSGDVLAELLADGRRVEFGSIASAFATIKGVFDGEYDAFDPARHRVAPHIVLKRPFAEKVANAAAQKPPRNVTEGERPQIKRVMDLAGRMEGILKVSPGGKVAKVLVSGKGLLAMDSAELVAGDGKIVAGRVTAATDTTLDCEFDEAVPIGALRLVVKAAGLAAARKVTAEPML